MAIQGHSFGPYFIVLFLRASFAGPRFGGQPKGLDPLTTDGPSAHPRAWPMGRRPIGHAGIMGRRPIIPLLRYGSGLRPLPYVLWILFYWTIEGWPFGPARHGLMARRAIRPCSRHWAQRAQCRYKVISFGFGLGPKGPALI